MDTTNLRALLASALLASLSSCQSEQQPSDATTPRPDAGAYESDTVASGSDTQDDHTNHSSTEDATDVPSAPAPNLPDASLGGGVVHAFPGAEGFGANATGGRGGRVVYVTNLNSSGPGSFQAALDMTGPRYVLFKVSGVIQRPAHLRNGDVTIAGQTSPGGIIVRGFHSEEEPWCGEACGPRIEGVENFIIRHIRSRPSGAWDDGMKIRYARNGIIDHVSIGNASDEAMQISYTHDLTVQNTIIAETTGEHSVRGGILINYTNPPAGYELDRLTLHHNMWNRIGGRFPEMSRESGNLAARTTMQIEVSNNLFWDQTYYADVNPTTLSGTSSGDPIYYQLNWIGNSSYARPDYPRAMINFPNPSGRSSTYLDDNVMNLYPARRDYQLMYCCRDYASSPVPTTPSWARTERHPFPAVTYTPSSEVRAYTLAHAGAFPRDPMDRRLLAPVRAGVIDPTPVATNPANDALATNFAPSAQPAAPQDSDEDGMPDTWEQAHGLDPRAQDHNGTTLSVAMTGAAGYTNLECYLNELADERAATDR